MNVCLMFKLELMVRRHLSVCAGAPRRAGGTTAARQLPSHGTARHGSASLLRRHDAQSRSRDAASAVHQLRRSADG